MERAAANERSLSCHLALAACRAGNGSSHLVNELMLAVYLSWYLQRAGYGNQPVAQFKAVEYAVEEILAHAHETGEWRFAPEVVRHLESLLALYDAQLARAPLHEVLDAELHMKVFLEGTDQSPIPLST
jgi:hypothetical protein